MSETRQLADFLVTLQPDQVPGDVKHEALRSLLNFLGCAVGAAHGDAVDAAIEALGPYSGPPTAAVLGRSERFDPLLASILNGISSHLEDFDDTIAKNFIHPTSPVAAALFAYASSAPVSGQALVHAFVLGVEAESRVGNAVYPWHYDAGWHITGTAGVFGAAAAIGRLLGLSAPQMVWAIGLAATQASGVREMFGSMAKSFHPGHAARNGYSAALMAQAGFTAGQFGIEGPRGFARVTSSQCDLSKITEGLGTHFELKDNTYKPFPCGIVIHPAIDAAIQIHRAHKPDPGAIRSVALRVHPIVLDLCNKKQISTGLEGKFSVYHATACGLVRGKAGVAEFTDEVVNDPAIRRVRDLVVATADQGLLDDAVVAEVTMASGERITKHVEHALGNVLRPMTDGELEEKFRDQVAPLLGRDVNDVIAQCWNLESLVDCRGFVARLTRTA